MSKLKPCPFCATAPEMDSNHLVRCLNASCITTVLHAGESRSEALRWWNCRPIEDALRAERDELVACMRHLMFGLRDSLPYEKADSLLKRIEEANQ